MTDVTTTPSTGRSLSLPARLFGVLVSPREAYADVAARPRWLGALLVTVLIAVAVTFWFQRTEIGQKAVLDQIDQSLRLAEALGAPAVPDEQYEQVTSTALQRAPYQSAAAVMVIIPLICLALAGIFLGVFNGILGGNARFKQLFALMAHSGVIWTLLTLFMVVMAFVRGDAKPASRLNVFFPMLPESGFTTYFLTFVDLFWLWGFFSMAVALAVVYRRRTGPIAVTLIGIYLCVGVAYAIFRSLFAGA